MTTDSWALTWDEGLRSGMTMEILTPKVADITAEGLALSGDLTGEDLGLSDADVSIRGMLAVGLDLRAVDRTICVDGVVEGTAIRQCVRCLKSFDDPMAFSIHVAYEREVKSTPSIKRQPPQKGKSPVLEEVESEERNDDLYYFTGDHLELAPMLREQLILASPMHPQCSDACLGLCAHCGKDLNEGPCRCPAEPTGSPFDVLREMKEKLRESRDR